MGSEIRIEKRKAGNKREKNEDRKTGSETRKGNRYRYNISYQLSSRTWKTSADWQQVHFRSGTAARLKACPTSHAPLHFVRPYSALPLADIISYCRQARMQTAWAARQNAIEYIASEMRKPRSRHARRPGQQQRQARFMLHNCILMPICSI